MLQFFHEQVNYTIFKLLLCLKEFLTVPDLGGIFPNPEFGQAVDVPVFERYT